MSVRTTRTLRLTDAEMDLIERAANKANATSVREFMRRAILNACISEMSNSQQPESLPTQAEPIPLDWLILTGTLVGELARAQLGDERVEAVKADALSRAKERRQRQQGAA